ncbi:MAG TPA: cache domain-containing protein [Treponemataceae bacterium]|nr:cache domain-containing protein [Treponemataceae bacterium]
MTLRARIFIAYGCLLVVIAAVSFVYTRSQVGAEMLGAVERQYVTQGIAVARSLEGHFASVEADIRTLAENPTVVEPDDSAFTSFLDADPATFRYRIGPKEASIIALFSRYRAHHPYVNSVYMGRENGSFVRSHPRTSATRYDPRDRPWYRLALDNPGVPARTAPYRSVTNGDVNIGTVIALLGSDHRVVGVLGMDVTLGAIEADLRSVPLEFGGYLEFWDAAGTVLISPDPGRVGLAGDDGNYREAGVPRGSRATRGNGFYRFVTRVSVPEGSVVAFVPEALVRERENAVFRERFSYILVILSAFLAMLVLILEAYLFRPLKGIEAVLSLSAAKGQPERMSVPASGELADFQEKYNSLVDLIEREGDELKKTKFLVITSLASLAQKRDNETGLHILRTQKYMDVIARAYGQRRAGSPLDESRVRLMVLCAPLHDIGKVAIPDCILLKPGRLTEDEFEEMKRHTTYGREALEMAQVDIEDRDFMATVIAIVAYHHERWDGTGYPERLEREAIPIEARFMALADVYDALTTARVYKPAFPHDEAVRAIREGRGTQFDPDVVDAFLAVEGTFREIAVLYKDG